MIRTILAIAIYIRTAQSLKYFVYTIHQKTYFNLLEYRNNSVRSKQSNNNTGEQTSDED